MAETQREKIVYISTNGPENPEKASLPFVLANAAMVMEVETLVVLQGPAVFLAKKGCLEHVHSSGFAPLMELVEAFFEQGGRLAICAPCIQERKIDVADLIEDAIPIAGGSLTEEILSANATLVY